MTESVLFPFLLVMHFVVFIHLLCDCESFSGLLG